MSHLGSRKRDSAVSKMERHIEDLPKLSNEMQLSIMNKVKSGELSIEDALTQARRDRDQLLKQQSLGEEPQEQQLSQYNFSVQKHGRYRWQKRVFQIDLKTKLLCSIERGIVKRILPFSSVKSCDDGIGCKFTISFKELHDYELEAGSLEDKHKMMQLVNQIIYGNIYSDSEEGNADPQLPQALKSLREGALLLHRGGLASFKWVKYEVKLHPGQLTLVSFRRRAPVGDEVPTFVPVSTVVHLSDGDTCVKKDSSSDSFTLITHKNEYKFKVPMSDQIRTQGAINKERDAWVSAIGRLCSEWKRKSMGEQAFVDMNVLRPISIDEDGEDTGSDLESSGGFTGGRKMTKVPSVDEEDAEPTDNGVNDDDIASTKPVSEPPATEKAEVVGPDISPLPVQLPTSPVAAHLPRASIQSLPTPSPLTSSTTVSEAPTNDSSSTVVKEPSYPNIPAAPPFPNQKIPIPPPPPPPPPTRMTFFKKKARTRAFHWDIVRHEKISKSFWMQENRGKVELDKVRLFEQFTVKDVGSFLKAEPSNTQDILLEKKIAHNFNIFLKSFRVLPGELKDKLFIVNKEDGGLSDEHITSLRRYVPTDDDVEMYKSHKGPVTDLHIVDQYMMEMCNIPYLSSQLDLLLILRELPNSMRDLQPLINQKIRMCKQLRDSRSFVSVLEYLLAIGNYLNENAGKGKAKGFRLSSLAKASQLRGKDRKFTLLHALVEQIMLHEACVATFTQELAEFETVPGASIKGLTAEIDVLKKELQKVIQFRKTFKKRNASSQQPKFSHDLKTAIDKHKTDLAALTKTCEEMKKLYSDILVKFGEAADQDSQELFGLICQFVHDFKRAYSELI